MDVDFMRQYYRTMYENSQSKAVEKSDTYFERKNFRYKKEGKFVDRLKSIMPELEQEFDAYLDAYADEQEILLEEMYLLGASDREKMLKI